MEFVNPVFLYGLLALAIPVLIHLFNFRRFKKVYFTNVAFIAALKQETQKQSRLRHWLVLLLRMLAIAALVLGFARPFIPVSKEVSPTEAINYISIYIDNSFSMQLESEQGMLLELAKSQAEEIAEAYGLSDRFQLLTNDFEGRHQRFVSRDEFIDWVEEVQPSPVFKDFDEVIQRIGDLKQSGQIENQKIYILSDYQKGFIKTFDLPVDSTARIYLVPLQSDNTNNVYIDSCWFVEPVRMADENAKIYASIRNASFNRVEALPISLKINGVQKAVSSLEIGAGESQTIQLNFTQAGKGIQFGEISLNDYPIDFDNTFYFSFQLSDVIRVLSIYEGKPNPYVSSFYENDSVFQYEEIDVGQLDYSAFRDYNFIILSEINMLSSGLEQELSRYLDEGGSLAIFPSANAAVDSYNSFLQKLHVATYDRLDTTDQKVGQINSGHPLFNGVFVEIPENIDLPRVKNWFPIQLTQRIKQAFILSFVNGKPFLNVNKTGNGKLYLCAVGLTTEFSNFQQHAIFVPIMYNMALDGLEGNDGNFVIGKDEMIRIKPENKGDQVFKIVSEDKKMETIPAFENQNGSIIIRLYDQIKEAGNYTLTFADQHLKGLSFNYDRSESVMDFYTQDELKQLIEKSRNNNIQIINAGMNSLSQIVNEINRGIPLWRWFIFAALAFLLAEVLLLRFWKK